MFDCISARDANAAQEGAKCLYIDTINIAGVAAAYTLSSQSLHFYAIFPYYDSPPVSNTTHSAGFLETLAPSQSLVMAVCAGRQADASIEMETNNIMTLSNSSA